MQCASRSRACRPTSRSRRWSRKGSPSVCCPGDRRAETAAPPHLDRLGPRRRHGGDLHPLHAAVTVSPKLMFDAGLATLVAVWFIGGRAIYRGLDLDVLLVQATAILTFLFLSAAISIGPLSRLWTPAIRLVYFRRHLGVATWALAMSHAAVVMHYGNNWKPANILEVLPGQKVAGIPFTLFGVGALLVLSAMALTSWDYFLHRWTPARWKRLHMAVYAGYAFVVIHLTARYVGEPPVAWRFLIPFWTVACVVGALHLAASIKEVRADRPAAPVADGLILLGDFTLLPEGRATTAHAGDERVAV